jgi:hypothetical protein
MMTMEDDMKKNLLAVLVAGCGLLCAQTALSADKTTLPSKVAFSPKKPIKLSIRVETSNEEAVLTCNKIIKFFIYNYKPAAKSVKIGPPWTIEVSKEYDPPYSDADKMVKTLRESVCGSTAGDFSWTVTQKATVHEDAKPKDAKPKDTKPKDAKPKT